MHWLVASCFVLKYGPSAVANLAEPELVGICAWYLHLPQPMPAIAGSANAGCITTAGVDQGTQEGRGSEAENHEPGAVLDQVRMLDVGFGQRVAGFLPLSIM